MCNNKLVAEQKNAHKVLLPNKFSELEIWALYAGSVVNSFQLTISRTLVSREQFFQKEA